MLMDNIRQKITFLKGVTGVQTVSQLQTIRSHNFFLLYDVLPHYCWMICLLCHPERAGWRSDTCGFSQVHSRGSQHSAAVPKNPLLSPVVRESLQLYPTGAAPVWVRGCGSLCCRERARIQATVVGYVSGILIFMKTKHFGPA